MVLKLGKTKMTMGRRDKKRATDNRTPGEGKIFGLLLLCLFLFFRRNRDNEIVLPPLSAAIGSGAQIEFLLCLARPLARSARVEVNTIDSLGMHDRPRAHCRAGRFSRSVVAIPTLLSDTGSNLSHKTTSTAASLDRIARFIPAAPSGVKQSNITTSNVWESE